MKRTRDHMGEVIDLDGDDVVSRGMRRRRARTGGEEKPVSRMFWIAVGAIVTVFVGRWMDANVPHREAPHLPPSPEA